MAASVAETLDLLTDILLRLPVKTLLRFKCVCKQWLSLISDPQFCHSHTLLHHKNPRPFPSALLFATKPTSSERNPSYRIITLKNSSDGDQYTPPGVYNFDFLNVPHLLITIMQSCNGLLLVKAQTPLMYTCANDSSAKYFVCNPTNKQFILLNVPNQFFIDLQLYLDFNPLRSMHFKVILIRFEVGDIANERQRVNMVNVYSSETGSWSDLGACIPSWNLKYMQGVYCNGAIHWTNNGVGNSLYFDVENQCFKPLPMPSNLGNHNVRDRYFGESGGHLHMVLETREGSTQLRLYILELKEDYSGWSMMFHLDLDPVNIASASLISNSANVIRSIHVFSIIKQEREEDSMIVFSTGGKVISYNLIDCTFRRLRAYEPFLKQPLTTKAFQYLENLFWVGAPTTYQHMHRPPNSLSK